VWEPGNEASEGFCSVRGSQQLPAIHFITSTCLHVFPPGDCILYWTVPQPPQA